MSISAQSKLNLLRILCSVLQIAGIIMIVFHKQLPAFTSILIGIAGFAGIVRYFILEEKEEEGFAHLISLLAAIAGFGIILAICAVK